jgi:hypothetical protein
MILGEKAEPVSRWQAVQWQLWEAIGAWLREYLTCPQTQPPSIGKAEGFSEQCGVVVDASCLLEVIVAASSVPDVCWCLYLLV